MSRAARPKQFLPLTGPTSLFQQTLRRVADTRYTPAVIITNSDYRFIVGEQASELGVELGGVLLEPVARNTAVAIAAAYIVERFGPDAVIHVLPSDHQVTADEGYWLAVDQAVQAASEDKLFTFGIRPTHPETGFGYIKSDATVGGSARAVERFVEKPDSDRATQMLGEGGYLWNSGMFMLDAGRFLAEAERLAPATHQAAVNSVKHARADLDFIRLDEDAFAQAPNISVDYAIFEQTDRAAVVAVDFSWSDLGSWDAVWRSSEHDPSGNVIQGQVTLAETSNSLVISDYAHVAVNGLDDVTVIATNDAVYAGRLSQGQKVGDMDKHLRIGETSGLTDIQHTAYRPKGVIPRSSMEFVSRPCRVPSSYARSSACKSTIAVPHTVSSWAIRSKLQRTLR